MAKILRITAKPREGFRRAGIHHPASPVDYAIEDFSEEQLAALKDEPRLVVEEVTVDDSEPPKKIAPGPAKTAAKKAAKKASR